ncbi:L-histidine N(alpha)-methyltransferase [Acuticoccus sediminis]|uniref:L-histidine N(Alpha)-methyltransferase n=1 Tax=Acuticoccus sediminis TaxID=2184697 RepID=A0A8B2NWF8_9HYPH|nr:L-histidine N(alpha)-methyltransferase [Acuticoccus sediminis]RAI02133.1 L-histidine N(alpha)-methyltransferase [Acuticoccus sediminis]
MDKPVVTNAALLEAARDGLTRGRKTMEPKWLYDAAGSELFVQITELPEYYPTRTEERILREHLERLAAQVPSRAELVELGSGASSKTRLLLDRLDALASYVPIDVSSDFLDATATELAADYPELEITPVVGDFTEPLALPPEAGPRVAFFPGSTIGNLDPAAAVALLEEVRSWPGIRAFILGVDLVKDPGTLVRAYDDAAGVTAAFNLNLLHRMNREIGTDFDTERFAHRAVWNAEEARIEMHLVSQADQRVHVGDRTAEFAAGETIHTESSRKFTRRSLEALCGSAGWRIADFLSDDAEMFGVAVLVPM